jgi:hypothetical protein
MIDKDRAAGRLPGFFYGEKVKYYCGGFVLLRSRNW